MGHCYPAHIRGLLRTMPRTVLCVTGASRQGRCCERSLPPVSTQLADLAAVAALAARLQLAKQRPLPRRHTPWHVSPQQKASGCDGVPTSGGHCLIGFLQPHRHDAQQQQASARVHEDPATKRRGASTLSSKTACLPAASTVWGSVNTSCSWRCYAVPCSAASDTLASWHDGRGL